MFIANLVIFLIIRICLEVLAASSEINHVDPIVAVNEGQLKGSVEKLIDGSLCYSFRGIPFATPPVGKLRFKAPLPPKSWKGIREAKEFGSICTQYNSTSQSVHGNEDCLFLNIYTKTLNNEAKIPVMVYIHGGYHYSGAGDFYTPDFLLQHDVILVTINYRLELLGFLSLDIPEAPGNAGIKDQVAALEWIQKNIGKFGGDKDSVTIFGESSGASSVTYHMLSPMSEGLFHKVIAESGVAIHDWAIGIGAKERAFRAGKVLGIDTDDVHQLLDFLTSLDANALTNLTIATLTPDEQYRGAAEHFVPVIEKKFPNVKAFITEHPLKSLVKNDSDRNKIPLMLGYNSGEGLFMLQDQMTKLDVYNNKPSYYIPREIADRVSESKLKDFGDSVMKFYFNSGNITEKDSDNITDIQTDIHLAYNIHRFAHLYSSLNGITYMYRFNYETDLNIAKISLGLEHMKGACHTDELYYLFYSYSNEISYKNQKKLREIVYDFTKLWTNFAKTGQPTLDNSSGVKWEQYTAEGREYLNIGKSELSMGRYADKGRIEFWNEIYKEAGVEYL